MFRLHLIIALFLVTATLALSADKLEVSRFFSDQMVLQQNKPTVIRGSAPANADIKVSFAGQEKLGKSDESGSWAVTLEPMAATAKPSKLTVSSGNESVTINDIVVGDVILFARQTSIDVSLGRDDAGKKAAASHKVTPLFRAITIKTIPAGKPSGSLANESTTGWNQVDSDYALSMSAAAYYLGRDLSAAGTVPVGIVDLNMGWYFPIGWLDRETLLEPMSVYGASSAMSRTKRMEEMYEAFINQTPYGKGKKAKPIIEDPSTHPLFPAAGYNAVIYPLRGIGLKSVLLQLGNDYPYMYYEKIKAEGKNTDRAILNDTYVKTYDIRKEGFRMEPSTIMRVPGTWREAFGDESLPIALIAPPSSELWPYAVHNREMREVQRQIADKEPATNIVLPGMGGVPFSGQPKDEALLAERCFKWVESKATGPVFDRVEGEGTAVTVYFKEGTASGLKAGEGALDHFEVANVDSVYVPAKAVIDGETIKITCDEVNRIFYVRYNWKTMPDQALVNAAGLPAIPFRTENAGYNWLVRYQDNDLAEEYYTPANEWKGGAVTLINGQLMKQGYPHFSGWLGPIGINTGPFGPNMGVREVKQGSPADGKLLVGDVIYCANGKMLGEEEEMTMAAAITESEATDGRLLLGVHRDGTNLDVEIQLQVLGRYSATSPWNCLKSERIVKNLEDYLVRKGAPSGFLHTDAMFLLGAGSPEHQWLVRKTASGMKGGGGGNNWALGYATQYLSEYYLSTGDKRVLPEIKKFCDAIAEMQIKEEGKRNGGWYGRGNKPRGYPAMAHTGVSAMLGLTLAKECGVEVDEETFQRGMAYLERKGAPVGQIIYGDAFRDAPRNIDPQQMLAGKLSTENGKVPEAAVLYNLLGDRRSAYINSTISTHAWYSTYGGHGGHFWDVYWTPLGSAVHSQEAYMYFMKNHRWFRECNRMYDGSLITGGKAVAASGLALVVPRRRLRILGAAKSPFSPGAPAVLKDALTAYYARDYAKAEEMTTALLADTSLDKGAAGTIARLAEESKRMQDCIVSDFAAIESLVKDGRLHQAGLILKSVTPIIAETDQRLATAQEQIKNGTARENDAQLYSAELKSGAAMDDEESKAQSADELKKIREKKAAAAAKDTRIWTCLTPKEFIPQKKNSKPSLVEAPADKATKWRFTVLENRDNAPEGWMNPEFDDSSWTQALHPVSWHLNHIALHRATFTVEDRNAYDLLKFSSWVFRQQDVAIYLNGTLIGRINNIEKKTGTIDVEFKKAAMKALKDGKNTLAIATRQNWRWGMLSMRVYNDGFDFSLMARLAKEKDDK